MKYPHGRILVFAKAPVSGEVKTRLAQGIGDDEATRIHGAMVEYAVAEAVQAQLAPVEIHGRWNEGQEFFVSLQERFGVELIPQVGADLGERMQHALSRALQSADYALLLGTDCPLVDAVYLKQAMGRLHGGAEVVLGPVEDGGYILIGMRSVEPTLFRGVNWGGSEVLEESRRRCENVGIHWEELPRLYDIDTEVDLRRLIEESPKLAQLLISQESIERRRDESERTG
jgi:rSAM/selenodomain-associated transferase 1